MKTTKLLQLTLVLALAIAAPCAFADALGQGTTPAGAAFTSSCAGTQYFSSLNDPGAAFNGGASDQYINCKTSTSTVGGSAGSTASNAGISNGDSFNNSSTAAATAGTIHISASNTGSPNVEFPGGAGNGGWNDQLTWAGPTGTWVVPIQIDGTMSASGLFGYGLVQVAAYQNNNVLTGFGNAANASAYDIFLADNTTHNGDDIYSSWDYEMVGFGVDSSVPTLNVSETLEFAIPVTFGQTFELGFYIDMSAGERSAGASSEHSNTTDLDFSNTVSYGGPGVVILPDNTVVTNFAFGQSASGFDYTQAALPEPSTIALLGLGLCGLGLFRRRSHSATR